MKEYDFFKSHQPKCARRRVCQKTNHNFFLCLVSKHVLLQAYINANGINQPSSTSSLVDHDVDAICQCYNGSIECRTPSITNCKLNTHTIYYQAFPHIVFFGNITHRSMSFNKNWLFMLSHYSEETNVNIKIDNSYPPGWYFKVIISFFACIYSFCITPIDKLSVSISRDP